MQLKCKQTRHDTALAHFLSTSNYRGIVEISVIPLNEGAEGGGPFKFNWVKIVRNQFPFLFSCFNGIPIQFLVGVLLLWMSPFSKFSCRRIVPSSSEHSSNHFSSGRLSFVYYIVFQLVSLPASSHPQYRFVIALSVSLSPSLLLLQSIYRMTGKNWGNNTQSGTKASMYWWMPQSILPLFFIFFAWG